MLSALFCCFCSQKSSSAILIPCILSQGHICLPWNRITDQSWVWLSNDKCIICEYSPKTNVYVLYLLTGCILDLTSQIYDCTFVIRTACTWVKYLETGLMLPALMSEVQITTSGGQEKHRKHSYEIYLIISFFLVLSEIFLIRS